MNTITLNELNELISSLGDDIKRVENYPHLYFSLVTIRVKKPRPGFMDEIYPGLGYSHSHMTVKILDSNLRDYCLLTQVCN
jgi:hypothetical protein